MICKYNGTFTLLCIDKYTSTGNFGVLFRAIKIIKRFKVERSELSLK